MFAGVKVLDPEQYNDGRSGIKVAEKELKATLEGLAEHLFGKGIEVMLIAAAGSPSLMGFTASSILTLDHSR